MAAPSDAAVKVLLALRDRPSDGYGLMAETGLDPAELAKVLGELLAQSIVFVKGDLDPTRIGEAHVSVKPSARRYADMMLQFKQSP